MNIKLLSKKFMEDIKSSVKRFPQAITTSIICVILLIFIVEFESDLSKETTETLGKIATTLALGIPSFLCINLYFERLVEYSKKVFWNIYILVSFLLFLYYRLLLNEFEMVSATRYVGVSLILYLTFLFLPYISKKENFELYVIRVIERFLTTVLYSIVLYVGLVATLFTIDKLLGVDVKEQIYLYTWFIVVGVFAVIFFLAGLPAKNEEMKAENYSKLIKLLIMYIIIPLLTIYSVILYIYFAKILITTEWPEGLVSHLVLWYSAICVIILFLITPLLKKYKWLETFMKIFPKVMLPLILMMFVSIFKRISAYGITENRYFVIALDLWVLICVIYFSAKKQLVNVFVPILLSIIVLISVCGPLSAYTISKYSQNKRFEKLLEKNNMLEDGKAVKASSAVSSEDSKEISSILRYFDKFHSLDNIKSLERGFRIKDTKKVLGIEYSTNSYYSEDNEYFYFKLNERASGINIEGYNYLFNFDKPMHVDLADNLLSVHYKGDDYPIIQIYQNGDIIYAYHLSTFTKILLDKYFEDESKHEIPLEDMQLLDENDSVKVKIVFTSVSGNMIKSTGKPQYLQYNFSLLVKVKGEE